jgi:flagellar export protein FliJ
MARRFEFRLETLLRVRQLRERDAKRKVAAQRAEIARLDRLDRETADEILHRQAELLAGQRAGPLDPLALQRGQAWIAHLRRAMALRCVQRTELAVQLRQLQAAWQTARTQARMIGKLRERRWEQYVRQRARQEQAATDELAQQLLARNSKLETGNAK